MIRRWFAPLALVLVLIAGLVVVNRPADAQSSGCSAVGGALSSDPGVPYDNSESRSFTGDFTAGETISASATGFDNPGTSYPVTLDVNGTAQNPYTVPADGSYTVTASVSGLPENANVTVSCSAAGGGGGTSSGGASWSGFTDGRLNPDPAEYYSLWCSGNTLNVYSAASGYGVLLVAIPLAQVQALPIGGQLAASDSAGVLMIVQHSDQDTFMVWGRNGNSAPNEGFKSFSLSQCLARNGGAVPSVTPTPIPRPPNTSTPSLTPSPTATATASATATAAPTNTRTASPTRTPTVTRTASPTKVPSNTPSATRTPTATSQPSATPTAAATPLVLYLAGLLTSPNDTDGDGVRDGYDFCKYEPGPANGCPDPDGDGVGGPLDFCPDSVGTAGTFGCGDSDGDGVHDGNDLCPTFAGSVRAYGCPDNDDDGVPNAMDWCPLQTVNPAVPQVQGCNDPDGDGFVNGARVPAFFVDNCPADNGANYANGCPPSTAQPAATVEYSMSLFAYAAQQGAFEGLVVQGYVTATPGCSSSKYGFCIGN